MVKRVKNKNISQALAIVCLILNLILPGLGTLIARSTQKKVIRNGVWQLVLTVVGAILSISIIGLIIGFFVIVAAWIWALVDSIDILKESS